MYWNKKKYQILAVCCISLLLAGCGSQTDLYVNLQEGENTEETVSSTENPDEEEEKQPEIYVQVSGAVNAPGVYCLPEGSRIFEAIEMAGGITDQAETKSLNQAELLNDGQMIYVYTIGEAEALQAKEAGQEDNRINLNTASAEELMTLPGVGRSKADAIVSYRKEQGAFEKIEDIMNITGIKEGVFSKIKDRIKVN